MESESGGTIKVERESGGTNIVERESGGTFIVEGACGASTHPPTPERVIIVLYIDIRVGRPS